MKRALPLVVAGLVRRAARVAETRPAIAGGDVDVIGLQHAAEVGFVRHARAQALQRGFLVAEGFEELKGEFLPAKGFSASSEMACSISTAFIGRSRD